MEDFQSTQIQLPLDANQGISTYGGLIILLDESQRASRLKERAENGLEFTDTISSVDLDLYQFEVCLLSFDGRSIEMAALARKGRRVATYKDQVTFSDFVEIDPINIDHLKAQIDSKLRQYLIRSSENSSDRVPPKTWWALIKLIKNERPEVASKLDELDKIRRSTRQEGKQNWFSTWSEERDAVYLSLEIAGFERALEITIPKRTPPSEPAPFLKTLSKAVMREDGMINHDASVFGNWLQKRRYQINAVEFQNDSQILTVMNVNRTRIEETLGVDLIYYHHTYKSFVLVQYKRLSKAANESESSSNYRPANDNSYKNEITRMRLFHTCNSSSKTISAEVKEFRLHPVPFYFKFCFSETFEPLSSKLISGMYLPLDYWERLLKSSKLIGPKGGTAVTYQNAERHINNTLFINLVQDGWIGPHGATTTALNSLITKLLRQKHSVTLAEQYNSVTKRAWRK